LPDGVRLTTIDNSGALEEAGRVFVEVVRGTARYER
jgi:ribose 1,5-bisphosphokinase